MSLRLLRRIISLKGPSDLGQRKSDPHAKLEALERWSARATLVILFGILVEIVWLLRYSHERTEKLWMVVADGLIALGLVIEYFVILQAIVATGEATRESDEKVAEANRLAAESTERAVKLEGENATIKARVAGRRITKEQHDVLCTELSKTPGVFDLQCMSEAESGIYAADISRTLKDAGWAEGLRTCPMGEIWIGLAIFPTADPAVSRLIAGFAKAKIPFSIGDAQHQTTRPTIMIGAKESAF